MAGKPITAETSKDFVFLYWYPFGKTITDEVPGSRQIFS